MITIGKSIKFPSRKVAKSKVDFLDTVSFSHMQERREFLVSCSSLEDKGRSGRHWDSVTTSDGKYQKNLVSIPSILLLQSIDTFFLFFYVRLRFGRADNLFYVEENLIKISRVRWKHFPVFSGS